MFERISNPVLYTAALFAALLLPVFCATPCSADSPYPTVNFEAGTLTLTFTDADDIFSIGYNPPVTNPVLIMIQDSNFVFSTPAPILFNGQAIPMNTVSKVVLFLNGGNDKLLEPNISTQEFHVYGGPGNDVIKVPLGRHKTYAYGGPGNDHINAEHAGRDTVNFIYGEDGNDDLGGSSDGENHLYGGPGTNTFLTYFNTWARETRQYVYHQMGAVDIATDMNSPTVYRFISSPQPALTGGRFSINEFPNGGQDVLDFTGWDYPAAVNLAEGNAQVASRDSDNNTVLTFAQAGCPGCIEQAIYPTNILPASPSNVHVEP